MNLFDYAESVSPRPTPPAAGEGTPRKARNAGMKAVEDHQTNQWREAYRLAAQRFIESKSVGFEFIGEDIRLAVQPSVGEPTHHNAWGAMAGGLLKRWQNEGRILLVGVKRCTTTNSHARLSPLYRVVSCVAE